MKKRIPLLLAHTCIILCMVLLTLLILDYINPSMDFINNLFTKIFIALFCLLGTLQSLILVAIYRKH